MELQTRLRLSFYKEIAEIDTAHNIRLVQHTVTGKIFVKKALSIYDLQVFQYLMTQKIPGTPKILSSLVQPDTPHRNNMAFPLPHRQLIFMRWVCCSTKC